MAANKDGADDNVLLGAVGGATHAIGEGTFAYGGGTLFFGHEGPQGGPLWLYGGMLGVSSSSHTAGAYVGASGIYLRDGPSCRTPYVGEYSLEAGLRWIGNGLELYVSPKVGLTPTSFLCGVD